MQKRHANPAKETAVKHERIVKKAPRLFRERGFENVSVGEVMKAAGLTHGAFYAHFGSKEELKAAAVADGLRFGYGGCCAAICSRQELAHAIARIRPLISKELLGRLPPEMLLA
jgi:TetR/AcrR family transcriptional repressor of nem operon